MKPNWQNKRYNRGDLWTNIDIGLHAEGADNLAQARDRMGVKTNLLSKSIPAVTESYTDEYVATQRNIEMITILLHESKELLANFLLYHQGYIKDLHAQKLQIDSLEVDEQDVILFELENMEKEKAYFQQEVENYKDIYGWLELQQYILQHILFLHTMCATNQIAATSTLCHNQKGQHMYSDDELYIDLTTLVAQAHEQQ
eukprot:5258112-Ditylum_brightwellii.AAC.1